MSRYNIAYRPSNEVFAQRCVKYARERFGTLANGYLLGRTALPHITLCQFEAPEDKLPEIWKAAQKICTKKCTFKCAGVYFTDGKNEHTGYIWTGLIIQHRLGLIAEQDHLAKVLKKKFQIAPLTASGMANYAPHLTFARLGHLEEVGKIKSLDRSITKMQHPFHLTLGISNPNGAYKRVLYSVLTP